ncbi:MAG TPA: flagellar basal body rod protein FlgB [Chthonomonadales bacterium]|nr:flagellar basal body rod protein FlgB [Chthonomonadales bacterium]
MLNRVLANRAFLAAQGALDGLAARHGAIADNIANVNTPGYKRKVVHFEDALQRAVASVVSPATGSPVTTALPFRPATVHDTATVARADGNNVDVEREMVLMAANTIRYQALSDYVHRFFSGLRSAINAGR